MGSVFESIKLSNLSTSSKKKYFVASYQDKLIEVSENVFLVLSGLKENLSFSEIANDLNEKNRKTQFNKENLTIWIESILIPFVEKMESSDAKAPLWIYKSMVESETLAPITQFLSKLYESKTFVGLIILSSILNIYYLTNVTLPLISLDGANFIYAYFILFLSIIFHELGHLSACSHFNIKHGSLGVGVLFYFPVFYADVSQSWFLSRSKRIIIDLGGVYFQWMFLAILCVLYSSQQYLFLKYSIYLVFGSIVLNLNPFFKFDGYWILTDLVGVPNLRKRVRNMVKYLLGPKKYLAVNGTKPFIINIGTVEKCAILLYTVVTGSFFVYIFLWLVPLLVIPSLLSMPKEIKEIYTHISSSGFQDMEGRRILNLVSNMFFSGVSCYFFLRIIRSLSKKLLRNV